MLHPCCVQSPCECTAARLQHQTDTSTPRGADDYLQNLRIEEAKRLLESSDCAVDEISYEIGYEDPSFFRRLFKRRTGVAPAQYRRVFKPIHQAARSR